VNPIAGMGGRVGLKGTDGVAGQALERGAQPIASHRAREMLDALQLQLRAQAGRIAIEWLSCGGKMGTDVLAEAGFTRTEVVLEPKAASDADDTKNAVAAFLEKRVDLVLFCGGDGTARDIASVAGQRVPLLGIPSGVKMYSGVFGTTPGRTAEILLRFLKGELRAIEVEVLDLDETKYRSGEWAIRQFQLVLTPFEPSYTQAAKQVVSEVPDAQAKSEIAAYMAEQIAESPGTLFILGPGSTVQAIAAELGVAKTVLGIDAIVDRRIVGQDLDERGLLDLLGRFRQVRVILSPIGAQGFVLGRGNLQLSPAVIRSTGISNIIVVATPAKLALTRTLQFDTGDAALDAELSARGHLSVVVGYRRNRMVRIAA
jgi:predicted polyphosphate/ATP-dependent NAD kinase